MNKLILFVVLSFFIAQLGGWLVFVSCAEAQWPIYTPDYSFFPNQVIQGNMLPRMSAPYQAQGGWTGGTSWNSFQTPFAPGPFPNIYSDSEVPWGPYTGYVPMNQGLYPSN